MSTLSELILSGAPLDSLETHLNALSDEARVEQCVALSAKAQKQLWGRAEGSVATLEQIVPPSCADGEEVRHIGRNSLPAFTRFEKRFCRPKGREGELWGYNEGSTRPLVGPGYFVCHQADEGAVGAVVVNYERLPTEGELPEAWPTLKPNEAGLSRFVYAHMHDYLRRVSEHVTIGIAYRHGKESPNYFVLCRER